MKKAMERNLLLRRLFHSHDPDIYRLGKLAGITWFDRFAAKFERNKYAYFSDEERHEALERIVSLNQDTKFTDVVNTVFKENERHLIIDRFVGEYYYFDSSIGVIRENRQGKIRREVRNALMDTKGRSYYLLKAIIELHKDRLWDQAYGGATWVDILAKTRELKGSYPAPRDVMLLKSYKLYYKTGSRRYPTHTVPEEIIPVVEDILDQFLKDLSKE